MTRQHDRNIVPVYLFTPLLVTLVQIVVRLDRREYPDQRIPQEIVDTNEKRLPVKILVAGIKTIGGRLGGRLRDRLARRLTPQPPLPPVATSNALVRRPPILRMRVRMRVLRANERQRAPLLSEVSASRELALSLEQIEEGAQQIVHDLVLVGRDPLVKRVGQRLFVQFAELGQHHVPVLGRLDLKHSFPHLEQRHVPTILGLIRGECVELVEIHDNARRVITDRVLRCEQFRLEEQIAVSRLGPLVQEYILHYIVYYRSYHVVPHGTGYVLLDHSARVARLVARAAPKSKDEWGVGEDGARDQPPKLGRNARLSRQIPHVQLVYLTG